MPRKRTAPASQLSLPLDAPDKFKVSQSKVKTYRRCRRAYHYKYVEKIKAKRKSRALTFGSLIHSMLELEAEGDNPMLALKQFDIEAMKLFSSEKAEYLETLEDARRIMVEYLQYWAKDDDPLRPIRIKKKSAEHSFEIEILPDILWEGKIDQLGRRQGLRWLVEHKTFKRRVSDDARWRNLQSATYFKAMDILGWPPVDGTCWDYIWSKAPMTPGLLADGKMSKKSIDTMPSAVQAAIKMHGLKEGNYKEFIRATEANRPKWFFRVYTRVDEEVKGLIFDDFISTVKEMADNHGKKNDMNPESHCAWCEFEPLCRARLQGLDYDFVKERNYEKHQKPAGQAADHSVEYEEE